MKPFRPMLAASLVTPRDTEETLLNNLKALHFPVLATPKLDGIRCITTPGATVGRPELLSHPVCRSLKSVPNNYVRDLIATLPPGLDGEILTYSERDLFDGKNQPRNFHEIQSDVMSVQGRPTFKFHVFDADIYNHLNYHERANVHLALRHDLPDFCIKVLPTTCRTIEDLQAFMSLSIQQGHEGICFRSSMHCPYKYGRSTLRQEWLVKWKLFETSEAIIVGFEEEMHNENLGYKGLLGQLERSSHQENMTPKGRLGSFIVKLNGISSEGETFRIGTGFTADMRIEFWQKRDELLGKTVTFKHQAYGAKNAPRIPVFVGIRSEIDV